MAEDALTILNAEGINRCHVVGHSMGGLIAAQLALMWPRRVKSLALLCTFPDGRTGARLTRDTFFTGLRTRIGTRAMRRKAFLSLVLSKAGMDDATRPALEATMTELFARDLAISRRSSCGSSGRWRGTTPCGSSGASARSVRSS